LLELLLLNLLIGSFDATLFLRFRPRLLLRTHSLITVAALLDLALIRGSMWCCILARGRILVWNCCWILARGRILDWNGCCILAGGRRRAAFLPACALLALALLARGRANGEMVDFALTFVARNNLEARVVGLEATCTEIAIFQDERETGRFLAWRTPRIRTPLLKPRACLSEPLTYLWIDHRPKHLQVAKQALIAVRLAFCYAAFAFEVAKCNEGAVALTIFAKEQNVFASFQELIQFLQGMPQGTRVHTPIQ